MLRVPIAVAAALAAILPTTATPAAAAGPACHVDYRIVADSTGFTSRITITNIGDGPLLGWTLKFRLPAGQSVVSGWNAVFSVAGDEVSALNAAHNGEVGPGEAAYPRFRGAGTDRTSKPTAFTVNGLACSA